LALGFELGLTLAKQARIVFSAYFTAACDIHHLEKKLNNNFPVLQLLSFFYYCCAGWGYTVAFSKVLTMNEIYHT
jgi:hypothetical protein